MSKTSDEFGKTCVVVPVFVRPIAKGRPRFGSGKIFTPKKTREYEAIVRNEAEKAMAGREPFDGPVGVKCQFCFKAPKKSAQNAGEWRIGRPDLDNLLKAVTDAMNGIVYNDDSQIAITLATKKLTSFDGVFVEVRPLEGRME